MLAKVMLFAALGALVCACGQAGGSKGDGERTSLEDGLKFEGSSAVGYKIVDSYTMPVEQNTEEFVVEGE